MLFYKHMSNNYIHIGTLNDHSQDHSKHVTLNVPAGVDVNSLVRSFFAEDVTPAQEVVKPAEPQKSTYVRGRKAQVLFLNPQGEEDIERTMIEAERVKKYIADHRMGVLRLDSSNTNRLNLMLTSFWFRWKEQHIVPDNPPGAALYRFATEFCNLPCDVMPRAFSGKICDLINRGKRDPEIFENLYEYFQN